MAVSFSDLQLASEFVSSGGMGENQAYLDRQSGKIHWHSRILWVARTALAYDRCGSKPPSGAVKKLAGFGAEGSIRPAAARSRLPPL